MMKNRAVAESPE